MTSFKKVNTFANRGASAEKAMAALLAAWADRPAYEANRLVDSKAAGRTIKAAAADFEYFFPYGHGLIEVKQTEHDYRLERSKLPQLARLRKRTNCGGVCMVAILHTKLKIWRVTDVAWLLNNGDKGSWNLSAIPGHPSLAGALNAYWPEVFHD